MRIPTLTCYGFVYPRQVALNERPRLLTEAETAKREAETQAEIIKNKAESDARILTNK